MGFNIELLILAFSLITLPYGFVDYKRKFIKNKFWWTYAFSGHALLLSSLTILLSLIGLDTAILRIISGTLMIVSSFGLFILFFVYIIENNRLMFTFRNWIIVWIHHSIMSLIGIWFLFTITSTISELLFSIILLLLYAFFMRNKVDVPWILYRPSKIPLNIRKILIISIMVFLNILLPILSYITKV